MKNTKNWAVLLMVVCMFVLAACGEKGTVTPDNSSSEQPAATTSETAATATPEIEAAKEPVSIEFWYGLGGKLGENVEKLIAKFNESQKEVIVKGIVQPDYTESKKQLQAAIAAKKVPAAVLVADMDWARKGYFISLDEMIAQDTAFNKPDFIPTFLEQGLVDGKQFFLPMYGTTQLLYYNKAIFERNAIDLNRMKTWEGVASVAKEITEKEKGKVIGWEPMWGQENLIDAVFSKGGKVISDDGKTLLIDSPEWIETWSAFGDWIHKDKIMSIHSGGQGWEYWYKTIDDVMKGTAAGYTGSSGDQGDLDFNIVGALEQPSWEGHEAKPAATALLAGIPALASPEEQQAAYKWLTFFNNTENTAFWSMNTGYIAVRTSALEDATFKAFGEANPQSQIPLMQAKHGSAPFNDPTGGKITDALNIAKDKVEIENIPAEKALKEAKEIAQKELDKALGGK
ncbi:extracellular solute-binding protein [Paenibacillus psychroresistens]|uniref:Extracellular solute-binding protein n=1 Tax=Paenibacillus psychroresistens TaxID=1778678 RepID=A0A6B8RBU0_9BACL|nr:extracellular solute-binding protein [Paenibacillus psychroresistens]QGQ93577.1 extracellular solute-binding protein [Paenibacillus psychroresistens]